MEDKVIHAKWHHGTDSFGDPACCCSNCMEELPRVVISGGSVDHPYPEVKYIDETDYCPSCGAKMDLK